MPHKSNASTALAALFATDDLMPEAYRAAALVDGASELTVLLDSVEAWAAWTVLLDHDCYGARVSERLMTAHCLVAGVPVLVVKGHQLAVAS
jgi:hypothetical protein